MEQIFCSSSHIQLPYWNLTSLWNSIHPDFPLCFQETSLVWAPSLYFILFLLPCFLWKVLRVQRDSKFLSPKNSSNGSSVKSVFTDQKMSSDNNDGNSLGEFVASDNVKKSGLQSGSNCLGCCCLHYLLSTHNLQMIFGALLIGASLVELSYALFVDLDSTNLVSNITISTTKPASVPLFETVTPAIKIVVFSLVLVMQYFQWNAATTGTFSMFIFWLIFMVQSVINTRTMLVNYFQWNITDENSDWREQYSRYHNLGYVIIKLCGNFSILVQFVLSLFCSRKLSDVKLQYSQNDPINPRPFVSVLSDLTFSWVNQMVWSGFRRPLIIDKLWTLQVFNKVVTNAHMFAPCLKLTRKLKQLGAYQTTVFECSNLILALAVTFWRSLLFTSFLKLLVSFLPYLNTQFMSWLLEFIQHSDHSGEPSWHGYFYVLLMILTPMTESFINGQFEFGIGLIAIRVRSCITDAIYCKSLRLSTSGRKHFTVGEIVNLMSIDTTRFSDFCLIVNDLWSAPLQIIFAMCLLWLQLSWACFAGLLAMFVLMPINWWIGTKMKEITTTVMKAKDKRIRLMNEILAGIKVLKLYAWEDSFTEQIRLRRNQELSELKARVLYQSALVFIFNAAPFLVTATSFATYILMAPSNQLTAQKAFVSLALFNQIRIPLNNLPRMITQFSMLIVSVKRITKFMQCNELDPHSIERINFDKQTRLETDNQDCKTKFDITVENGTFSWSSEPEKEEQQLEVKEFKMNDKFKPIQANLEQIDLKIPKGKLVAIVGQVGSGKTTLLNALLGNLHKLQGKVMIHDSISYVAQQAWIQNATLRDNILYLNPMDEKKFAHIIEACALGPDIAVLSGGVETEIGEKGINVSGGQKQRIAIARACYAGGSLFLFDDPLSALDAHVGRHIFDQIIGPNGLLNQTTRVLVTHRLSELPDCDFIYVLKNGRIAESGTYQQLMQRTDGEFAEFLQQQQQTLNNGKESQAILDNDNSDTKLIAQYFKEIDELSFCSIEEDDFELRKNSIELELIRLQSLTEQDLKHRTSSISSSSSVTTANNGTLILRPVSHISTDSNRDNTPIIQTNSPAQSIAVTNEPNNRQNSQISNDVNLESQIKTTNSPFDDSDKNRLISDEKSAIGSVKWSNYLAYLKQLGVLNVIFIFAFHISSVAFNLGASQWLARWSQITDERPAHTNLTRNPGHSLEMFNIPSLSSKPDSFFLIIYIAIGFSESLFILAFTLTLSLASLRGAGMMHDQMLTRIIRAPLLFFDTNPMGRILNRFSRDVDVCDTMLNMYMRMTMLQTGRLLASILVIAFEVPYVIAAIVPMAIIYYVIQKVYIASSRQLRRIESVTRSPIYSHFSETISGASTIRAFGKVDQFVHESHCRIDTNNRSSYSALAISRWLSIRLEFLGYMVVFANALYFVIMRKEVDASSAGLTLSYSLTITRYLNNFIISSSNLETNIVSVERCLEYISTPVEAEYRKISAPTSSTKQVSGDWPSRGEIRFENYSTRYRPGLDLVLNRLNFAIQSNHRVGVVGRTGAGKSSLTLALFRILEGVEGRILIDGQDIGKLPLFDLRSRLTIIPQDPVLFTGTLRYNLDPFGGHDDSELWSALELTSLKSFVESLELGLDYQISEGGENLSAGQKQLLCLARALVRRSKVLIMDEATAAVDIETDELIQQTIRSQFLDCTILTIAHRINTIIDYDRVLVLDQGTIAEFDSPQNLLANPLSIFRSMATEAGLCHSYA